MADETQVFERFVVGAWEAKGKPKLAFPISRLTQSYSNRLAKRRRPYLNGWKLDDTGSEGVIWEVESVFHNDQAEDGLPEQLYPDHADAICDSFVVHEVGTLTTPTRGQRRCRLESFRRVEDAGVRDCCTLSMVFWEDNEAGLGAEGFTAPSAQAIARILATDTVDALADAGVWNGSVAGIQELAAGLQALAAAPGEYVGDLEAQAGAIFNAVQAVEGAFTSAASDAAAEPFKLLLSPESSRAGRLLRRLGDVAMLATLNRARTGGTRTKRYPRQVSIFDVAAEEGQAVDRLIQLNARVPDFLRIPANTPILLPEI